MALADDTTMLSADGDGQDKPVESNAPSTARKPQQPAKRRRRSVPAAVAEGDSPSKAKRPRTTRHPGRARREAARRSRALDGLGGLAILAILGHSLGIPWLAGGHLGIVVLLVLASYLLTSTQLQRMRRGIGAVPHLWAGILGSVWPPLAIMSALTVIACMAFGHELLPLVRQDVLPGLALVENVSYAVRNLSPFAEGAASPLGHLWYLGIYAQFCLIWPLVMLLGYAALPSRTAMRRLTLVFALVSAAGMALMCGDGSGAARVYFGTDTRAFAPLLGAWLAYALPLGKKPARGIRRFVRTHRLSLEIAGICSLAILAIGMVLLPGTSPILYRGGMLIAAVLVTVVLATLALPGGILTKTLAIRPLSWLGSRSLGIYLWHYPVFRLLGFGQEAPTWWLAPIAIALTLALAELSHQLMRRATKTRAKAAPAKGLLGTLKSQPIAVASPVLAAVIALTLSGFSGSAGLALTTDQIVESQNAGADAENPSEGQAATEDGDEQAEAETGASDDADENASGDATTDQPTANESSDEASTADSATEEGGSEGTAEDAPDEASDQSASEEEQAALDVSSYPSPHVLIIGNSFTYYNDMPSMLSEDLGTTVVSMVKGSAKLSEHLSAETEQGGKTLAALDDGPWDFVVIQEMSTLPIDDKERYLADLTTLVDLVRERGAVPIIYGTWAYDTGRWGAAAHGMTVPEMHEALQASFAEASELTGAPIANVGQAFADRDFDLSLYNEDGKHPSAEGSDLAAEVIAQAIWENGGA